MRRAAVGLLAVTALAGCSTFAPEEGRVSEINKSAGGYAEQAILLNVIRAQKYEPLSFVTVTGLDGTTSVQGSLGFGGFTLGPHLPTSPHTFLLGPDAVARTGSNTFHVSVVDDPASFVALLSPMTPATIAFFINQGYPRELLFFLAVDRITVQPPAKAGAAAAPATYRNDPTDAGYGDFIGVMASLLRNGLVAELDVGSVPSGRSLPGSTLCFDASLPVPAFARTASPAPVAGTCVGAQWLDATPAAGASPGGGAGAGPGMVSGGDGTLWVASADGKAIRHLVPGKPPEEFPQPAQPKTPGKPRLIAFPVTDGDGVTYQIYFRSVYSVYSYLGALRRGAHGRPTDISNLLPPDSSNSGGILNITADRTGCFAEVDYDHGHYCVPATANNTKRVFSLLHQLQELSTAPSNAPTTLTVTAVP